MAHDFVAGCLMKIPKLRLTYPMLLQHPWLGELIKPATIAEEDEEAAEAGTGVLPVAAIQLPWNPITGDKEVETWVLEQLEIRRSGAMAKKAQPALHAAPLDVASPAPESRQ